ncbi:MAG: hypothetical protein D6820_08905 [Lentisphaerae bacterium]|nr:MAG: hypothetical protein D6820_08905 [Lentisphaerota bacterium]
MVYEGIREDGLNVKWIQPPNVEVSRWFSLSDPDNIWKCREEFVEIIDHCRKVCPDSEVILNPTSGTKQMTTAAVIAGLDMDLKMLHFITGQRRDGVVASGTEKTIHFSARQYMAGKIAQQAAKAIDLGAYPVAIEMLAGYRCEQPDLWEYAHCLQAWHRMDYATAQQAANNIHQGPAEWARFRDRLNQLNRGADCPIHAVDLYLAGKRLLKWGLYEESLARLYRMMEMIAQVRLDREYAIRYPYKLSKMPKECIPVNAWNRMVSLRNENDNTITLGLVRLYQLLKWLGDPLGQRFESERELFLKMLHKRNTSYVGHSRQPVAQHDVEEVLKRSKPFLCELSPAEIPCLIDEGEFPPARHFIQKSDVDVC